ncbi:hypothetical protein CEUSTIGMA_g9580.t1 [Chlamydomonas eustigma]|uniref:RCC1-like domain-containing protein n=1 Tax=Chlamydomonas eustigma TaxID=1157962 RepID=A0A250XGV4_9CHLO|nr:hypothetical protein CEUSTIGMA_g9580.t1 [Chlamydomonas eustigma]|eukprot:GAX82152.1 hypothetical protein CEUSTIGMA_g9580.t1 [Chlamydomonas eustigma]
MAPQWHRFLACFGNGLSGRLGTGVKSENFPRILGALIGYDMKQASCGGAHTAAVTDDGTLFTFGLNDKGQLGHSRDEQHVPYPLEVGLPDAIRAVSAGEHHTLCVTTSGEVWAFGSNECGQLGIGQEFEHKYVEPRLVKQLKGVNVVAVTAGVSHSLALSAQGDVFSWGQSDCGALGHGPETVRKIEWMPRVIRTLSNIRSITSGYFSSGCIDQHGRAFTWGHGLYWQLGHGEACHEFVPRRLEGINVCGSLSLGQMHGLATGFEGRTMVWGSDDFGTLGQGDGNWQSMPLKKPKEVPGLSHVKSVACGWKHSAAVTTEGKLYTWGWNGTYQTELIGDYGSGQLGHGDMKDKWSPIQVMRFKTNESKFYDLRMPYLKPWRVVQASAGRNHTAMIVDAEVHMNDLN